jgi:hypothetical protein
MTARVGHWLFIVHLKIRAAELFGADYKLKNANQFFF